MKTVDSKLVGYFELIAEIKYENEHGGAYAYMQFLACTRNIMEYLKSYNTCHRHIDAIEGINWILNEYLGMKFSPRHYSVFEAKRIELSELSGRILYTVQEEGKRMERERLLHAA
jgi:hypothetical protein